MRSKTVSADFFRENEHLIVWLAKISYLYAPPKDQKMYLVKFGYGKCMVVGDWHSSAQLSSVRISNRRVGQSII